MELMSEVNNEERAVRSLYEELIDSWNKRDAAKMASLFAKDGNVIGFDGSQMNGPGEIASTLGPIFKEHPTAPFVTKVREVRFLKPGVAVVRAVVGMVPPGQSDIKPDVNAIQTMVASKDDGRWRVAVFQNTPAAFHGRPELAESLTQELREVLRNKH
jgi:uncharacterized protein (TIGR02246 family)